jgi:hypothetical protein
VRTAIGCNGRLTTDNGRSALCWRRAAGLGGRINQRDHESATNLPRWCLKTRAQDYTLKCDFNRENRAKMKTACATSRGVLRQIRDVGKLSQNYFAREFTSFPRASSWQICQMLSQKSVVCCSSRTKHEAGGPLARPLNKQINAEMSFTPHFELRTPHFSFVIHHSCFVIPPIPSPSSQRTYNKVVRVWPSVCHNFLHLNSSQITFGGELGSTG